jgi:hypothetical protein
MFFSIHTFPIPVETHTPGRDCVERRRWKLLGKGPVYRDGMIHGDMRQIGAAGRGGGGAAAAGAGGKVLQSKRKLCSNLLGRCGKAHVHADLRRCSI